MSGQPLNPRDSRGWRVPRPDCDSYSIYHLMVAGFSRKEIAQLMDLEPAQTGVLMYRIRHPNESNAASRAWNKTHREELNLRHKIYWAKESKFAKKLMRDLGIGIVEARRLEAELKAKDHALAV